MEWSGLNACFSISFGDTTTIFFGELNRRRSGHRRGESCSEQLAHDCRSGYHPSRSEKRILHDSLATWIALPQIGRFLRDVRDLGGTDSARSMPFSRFWSLQGHRDSVPTHHSKIRAEPPTSPILGMGMLAHVRWERWT
jgi:hypothetical protein